jgi:hypothetical protein
VAAYLAKSGASAGGSGRLRQAVGLSLKIWIAVAPICRARRAAFSSPPWIPRWIPTRGAPSGQSSRRRGSGRATVRPMTDDRGTPPAEASEDEPRQPGSTADLLSIGLLVFFVALLLVVAALLALPLVLG